MVDMYNDLLNGLLKYIDNVYMLKTDAFRYYAVLNILFFRTINSCFIKSLSEIMLNRNLTRIKIEKSTEVYYIKLKEYNLPITEYQLYLAITAAVGAESQLLLSIIDGKLKMTYDKLTSTVNKLVFTMLKISESEIKEINTDSQKIADEINMDKVLEYLKNSFKWLQC